ncbi:MAG: alpha/beta fold hydrolase [Terriglobus roseus]|nr:alpha/beta fold hydrolase [Terriglobus roseus]
MVYANAPGHHFYNDLPEEEQKRLADALRPHSIASFKDGARNAAHLVVPSSYLLCELDNAIVPAAQEAMVQGVRDAGADMRVERLKCGHSPFLSHPDETVDFLLRAAKTEH